jgi:hypothetical protein
MKQPLMLIPPAQSEVLSDIFRIDIATDDSFADDRLASSCWLDDDLPEELTFTPGDSRRVLAQTMMQLA